ncbi:MAG: methylated-DNA--[protein]-cysteine S-methyltransferase [Novosphingobium sp.]|nr:methylated-DNA--[protein]-cysteine S-methyltransferase [Novosphingobium sp.]
MTITDPDRLQAMEQAFAARDRSQDGRFVVAVTTTGIYCRPSCPARRPRPENTRYFSANRDAEAAGFRPCKRCRPDEAARDEAAVHEALAAIRAADAPLALDALSALTGYSPAHFQRVFKRLTGLSPAAYGRALREERAREALRGNEHVTGALYEAGFEAPSRFYDAMKGRLGMAPSAWSKGGEGVRIEWAVVPTTLGAMLVAATDRGVCRLSFDEGREALAAIFPRAELVEGGAEFSDLLARVIAAVEAPGSGADIPLDVKGTAFQEAVWRELRRIPAGETRSYSEIAAAAGKPKAVRAAGSANGANNVAVLIPCHRVLRSDGSIGGYAYGTAIKQELLRRERG